MERATDAMTCPVLSIELQMLTTKNTRKCPASNNIPGDSD